jgi:hypothetical protein
MRGWQTIAWGVLLLFAAAACKGTDQGTEAPKKSAPSMTGLPASAPEGEAQKPTPPRTDASPSPQETPDLVRAVSGQDSGRSAGTPPALPRRPSLVGTTALHRALKQGMGRFKGCFEKQLESTPDFAAKVTLELVITADGKVAGATIVEAEQSLPEFNACIVDKAKVIRFPKGKEERTLRVPLNFVGEK